MRGDRARYVGEREGFGIKLADRESVQIKLGEVAQQIQIGRLLIMHAAWMLDQGARARKEVSMAKVHVADALHQAADVAIQLNGARGYSKDTVLEWIYRYARVGAAGRRRLRSAQDGARAVHARGRAGFLAVGLGRSLPLKVTLRLFSIFVIAILGPGTQLFETSAFLFTDAGAAGRNATLR